MKNFLLNILGLFLHSLSLKRFNITKSHSSGLVLMAGPSADLDDLSSESYSVSITSNLMNPLNHIERVNSNQYFHCFSDPSIITHTEKFQCFKSIIEFSETRNDYFILIPVQYFKSKYVLSLFFNKKVYFYNQNNSYQKKQGLKISKYSFPNMDTILLDCAIPWLSYIGVKDIFISGFDANYGNENIKKYTSSNYSVVDDGLVKSCWAGNVRFNAYLITELLKRVNNSNITFSKKSGFWKHLNEKINSNW